MMDMIDLEDDPQLSDATGIRPTERTFWFGKLGQSRQAGMALFGVDGEIGL
ncbi:uncharacterized protein FFB20_04256 [Fusarium fujikuroi]|nr:uncharacterized protein FFE2_00720 [Fusarium fujikuroi]SCN72886.1 uncharacterized protein FFB20_04256 [Fusarium fujikuroi]